MAAIELAKKEREYKERQLEHEAQVRYAAAEAKKVAGNKSLLDNIKSFDVEDI
jgi:hypothetical protein